MKASAIEVTSDARPGNRPRVPRLDGIRGLLAVGVIGYHVAYQVGDPKVTGTQSWDWVMTLLQGSLPPFFVMSGLLLYRNSALATLTGKAQPPIRSFYVKRALRILPAYWTLTIVVLLALNFYNIHSVGYFLDPLLLIHFFTITNPAGWITGMEPSWTVPTEITFYLLLPFLARIIDWYARKAPNPAARMRRMMVPIGLFVLAGLAWTTFAYWPANSANTFYYAFWPFGCSTLLAGGMALATLYAYADVADHRPALFRLVDRRPNIVWISAVVVYLIGLPKFFGNPGAGDYGALVQEIVLQLVLLVFAVLLVAHLSLPNIKPRIADTLLGNAPMQYLGKISYSIYLWHLAFIHVWFKNGSIFGNQTQPVSTFRGQVGFLELFVFVFVCSVIAATISRYVIELPAMRLRDRLVRAVQGKAAASESQTVGSAQP